MLPSGFLNLHRGNISSQLVTAGGEITLVTIHSHKWLRKNCFSSVQPVYNWKGRTPVILTNKNLKIPKRLSFSILAFQIKFCLPYHIPATELTPIIFLSVITFLSSIFLNFTSYLFKLKFRFLSSFLKFGHLILLVRLTCLSPRIVCWYPRVLYYFQSGSER